MRRALSFGSGAEAYERFRPGYPDRLVGLVVGDAPVERALEIGAGTGKATRVFARHGIAVTATEPDGNMLTVLVRECGGLPVTPVRASLETVALDETYDLVYAAAALHWTESLTRWDRIAALLGPGGIVASIGGGLELADPELADVEHAILASHLPEGWHVPAPTARAHGLDWPGNELATDARFHNVRQQHLPKTVPYLRADYLGLLGTVSAIRVLDAADRAALLERLDAALPETVALRADLTIHTALRR
ncbi:class I SAM-dependent methyltransferase [Xylanimonas sp. McL0601]|uniref:class I SAM-dependent methyltransferase n=1 Tax=Xylanimonas sp. McL0601 TaxID=3414739 RepID=UPI003CF1295C